MSLVVVSCRLVSALGGDSCQSSRSSSFVEAGQSKGTPALQRQPALSIVKRGSGPARGRSRAAIVVVCGGFGVVVVGGPKNWEGVWVCDLRTLESAVLSGSGAEEDSPLGGLGFGGRVG